MQASWALQQRETGADRSANRPERRRVSVLCRPWGRRSLPAARRRWPRAIRNSVRRRLPSDAVVLAMVARRAPEGAVFAVFIKPFPVPPSRSAPRVRAEVWTIVRNGPIILNPGLAEMLEQPPPFPFLLEGGLVNEEERQTDQQQIGIPRHQTEADQNQERSKIERVFHIRIRPGRRNLFCFF